MAVICINGSAAQLLKNNHVIQEVQEKINPEKYFKPCVQNSENKDDMVLRQFPGVQPKFLFSLFPLFLDAPLSLFLTLPLPLSTTDFAHPL